MDKLDEISTVCDTKVCDFKDGRYNTYTITPEQFGFTRGTKDDLKGGTPEENAQITRSILSGEKGIKRDTVVMNAGAALYAAGKVDSLEAGIRLAQETIDSGAALKTLEKFVELSNKTL